MMSEDKASLCEPRNRNGRMLVGSALNNDVDSDAEVADCDVRPAPRHSHDNDDDNDDDVLDDDDGRRGTEGVVAQRQGTRLSRDRAV